MRFLSAILLVSGLALAVGFGGRLHGVGDTLAVVRPLLALIVGGVSVLALLIRPRRLGALGLSLSVYAAWSMAPPPLVSVIAQDASQFSIYQKNLLFLLPDTVPVADDIAATGADFVTLQELHARNRPILQKLQAQYPHQHFCPFARVGGIAALSRWPKVQTVCDDGHGLAAMQVSTPSGHLWIVSLHLHWPFPYGQSQQLKTLAPIIETFDGPVLIGGDFNMVPWSHAVRSISEATDTKLSGYTGGTFAFSYHKEGRNLATWLPRLPIDHILVPKSGDAISLQRRDRLGSDHHGVLAEFIFR